MADSAGLQNLHDIVVPGPVGHWPPAPGWYLLLAIVAGVAMTLLWKGWRHWRCNRYRGEALRELSRVRNSGSGSELAEIPVLLKRAALSAWPRERVAGLVGADWHRFLDESAGSDCFVSGVGNLLDRLAYAVRGNATLSDQEVAAVLDAARMWLKRHRAPREGG